MEVGRDYVLRAVEIKGVHSETATAKAAGFARVTVGGEDFNDCLVVEKKMFVRSKCPGGYYNILEDCGTVYYAREVGPIYSQFTTKYITEKKRKQRLLNAVSRFTRMLGTGLR